MSAAVHHQHHDSEVAMRIAPLLPALVVALTVACDGGAPVEPARPVQVTSVDTLRPGQIAHVRGSGLTNLRSLLLDGVEATELVARSDSVAEFRVPSMRACETDMRAVKVSADGGAPIGAVVRVPPSVSLRPAESRVLTEDDLRCLRLPAADEDYVLSAANLRVPTAPTEVQRPLVAVRLLGTGDATASTLAASDARGSLAPFDAHGTATPVEPALSDVSALTGSYSQAPVPFDPRYPTAVAGDTLRFVDWYSGAPQICQQPAETVPSFRAKVVAVSGKVAVAVDLRHPLAAAYLDPEKLGWLRTASRIASGQPLRARHSAVGSDAPAGVHGASIGLWGQLPERGPWQTNGRYGTNARMLLFLRELAGEASVDHGRWPTLYQRLIYAPIEWNNRPAVIAHITSVLGIDYAELIDRQTRASVTAGLIDAGVAHDLPRYTSWDHSERARLSGPLSGGGSPAAPAGAPPANTPSRPRTVATRQCT
jgi:hypothetical protein